MKVVLFCGGMGMRIREYSDSVPKPMVPVGPRPILWHVMKYYASYGHNEFILCLGHRGDAIKQYFRTYDESISNDFTLYQGETTLHASDIQDWRITFVDTGLTSNIGMRLMAVKHLLGDDEHFLANYSDGLTDLHLPEMLASYQAHNKIASFLSVRPAVSFHLVDAAGDGMVRAIRGVEQANVWINGGYFIFNRAIFDYMRPGEELVEQPFARLVEQGQLATYHHKGFWACMDTFKEKVILDEKYARGDRPWAVWERNLSLMAPTTQEQVNVAAD